MDSPDKRLQKLQQWLSKAKQNLSSPSQFPISETSFYSAGFKDGVVEFFTTEDKEIIYFEFCGMEFNFSGFSVTLDAESKSRELILKDIEETLEDVYKNYENEIRSESPKVLH